MRLKNLSPPILYLSNFQAFSVKWIFRTPTRNIFPIGKARNVLPPITWTTRWKRHHPTLSLFCRYLFICRYLFMKASGPWCLKEEPGVSTLSSITQSYVLPSKVLSIRPWSITKHNKPLRFRERAYLFVQYNKKLYKHRELEYDKMPLNCQGKGGPAM